MAICVMAEFGDAPCQCFSLGSNQTISTYLFDGTAPALHAAKSRSHDQRLPKRVRMPRRSRAGLKGDGSHTDARGLWRGVQRVDAYSAGKPGLGAFL